MNSDALLATVPSSCAAFAAAARDAGMAANVPTCPEWSVEKLVSHTGRVLQLVGKVVQTGGPVDAASLAKPPAGPLVVQWFEEMAASTVAALATIEPSDPLWNWAGQPPLAAFWYRRMAHETAVHGADAALAAGQPPSIEPGLAADGIDEFLTVILPAKAAAGIDSGQSGTMHVHCTDTDGEWLVTCVGTEVTVTRGHAKGDVVLRGPAADLLLRLSNRGLGGEVIGDPGVLAAFTEAFRF